ncbi:hypothetical protein [Burkholderia cepacia]|uniref:hypothetical protein n=1 Tax=Burkholderia cepacia TaxID=292 RepID=UPI003D66C311
MDEREDSKILRRLDEEHVSVFKARAGMGAVIMEGQEIGAVVRYIEALEREAARRTTPDREAIIAAAWKVVREALDDVVVHPCDQHDDDVKARRLPLHMHALYLVLQATSDKGGE